MQKILLIHGANLNRLGQRDQTHYGNLTLSDLEKITVDEASKHGLSVVTYQSNHEGDLIDKLQTESKHCHGIIINAGAFSHYSYALHDAILDTKLPTVEVHLSNIYERETWRRHSVISPACIAVIAGKKEQGYLEAIHILLRHLSHAN